MTANSNQFLPVIPDVDQWITRIEGIRLSRNLVGHMVCGWELGEYLSAFIVVIAVCGEFVGEFTDSFTAGDEAKKRRLRKLSTLVLVAALAVELLCLVRSVAGLPPQEHFLTFAPNASLLRP